MNRTIFIVLFCLPVQAWACSFSPDYRSKNFLVYPSYKAVEIPPKPIVSVSNIKRGFDDGNFGSCSDAGIIELKVSTDTVGYDVNLIGPDEYKNTIPNGLYGAVYENGEYFIRFIWLDGASNVQEPLSIEVEIRATSTNGGVSDPIQLTIEHSGISH